MSGSVNRDSGTSDTVSSAPLPVTGGLVPCDDGRPNLISSTPESPENSNGSPGAPAPSEAKDEAVPIHGGAWVVRISGLPYESQHNDVIQFLELPKGTTGVVDVMINQQQGVAFATLSNEDAYRRALRKHKEYMGPRYINVDASSEQFLSRAKSMLQSDLRGDRKTCVVLRGIPFRASRDDIVDFVRGCEGCSVPTTRNPLKGDSSYPKGVPVGNSTMATSFPDISTSDVFKVRDRSGRLSGDAFVYLRQEERAAAIASKAHRQDFWDRWVHSSIVAEFDVNVQTRGALHRRMSMMGSDAADSTTNNSTAVFCGGVVHMSGLPYRVTINEIRDYFAQASTPAVVLVDPFGVLICHDGRPTGEAFAFLQTEKAAIAACEQLSGMPI